MKFLPVVMILMIIFNLFSEPSLQRLLRRAESRQQFDIRPGTHANNMSIFNQFVLFLREHKIYFRQINEEILCAYIEFLAERVRSPATIKNYLSALSATYARMGLSNSLFIHYRVKRAIVAIEKTVRHTPTPASSVSPQLLKSIILALTPGRKMATIKFLFIAMYMSLLRQSNFLSETVKKFDPTRQMTKSDASIVHGGLLLNIKWEKNHQTGTNTILLPHTNDIFLCPVQARDMLAASPRPRSCDPLICFNDRNNITVGFIRKVWRAALRRLGKDPRFYTLHGLRRGGTTFLASSSKSARAELKEAGRWKSNVYRRYISNPKASSVYTAWKRL